jgi:EpsI family protein
VKAGARYWIMLGVLAAATTGLAKMSHGEATPAALPLAQFPKQVAGYGDVADVPFDKASLDILKASDYLNRVYYAPGLGELGLYIAYFETQRTGATIHSPKNCLPGAGWQPSVSTIMRLQLSDGRRVPVNMYIIRKALDEQVVLYWYQSHGRVIASEYWGKFYMVYDALRLNRTDAALVRITAPVLNGDENQAREHAITFAKQVALDVEKIIPR